MTRSAAKFLIVILTASLTHGCAIFRHGARCDCPCHVEADPIKCGKQAYATLAGEMVDAMLKHPGLLRGEEPAIVVPFALRNRAGADIDMPELDAQLVERLEATESFLVPERERRLALLAKQGYDPLATRPHERIAIGRLLGARYVLVGSLRTAPPQSRSREQKDTERDKKSGMVRYEVVVELTAVETELVVARIRKPLECRPR